MKFGPFTKGDCEKIARILQKLQIPFSQEWDSNLLSEEEKAWLNDPFAATQLRIHPYDPAFGFFEIAEEHLKIDAQGELKEYGVASTPFEPNFDSVDYRCPKCRYYYVPEGAGELCPKHGIPLIPEDLWNELRRSREERRLMIFGLVVIASFIATVAWISVKKFF